MDLVVVKNWLERGSFDHVTAKAFFDPKKINRGDLVKFELQNEVGLNTYGENSMALDLENNILFKQLKFIFDKNRILLEAMVI